MKKIFTLDPFQFLAVFTFVLWSVGRVVNPVLRAHLQAGGEVPSLLAVSMALYVFLHVAMFAYTARLLAELVSGRGFRLRGRRLWTLLLYLYVLLALAVSVYFIAYELGYLPEWLYLKPLALLSL